MRAREAGLAKAVDQVRGNQAGKSAAAPRSSAARPHPAYPCNPQRPRSPRRAARPRGEVSPRLLARENKGAAPRAAPIGPGGSSEQCSQSGGWAAQGTVKPASQSATRARPACPGTGQGWEPGAQVAPGVAVPVNLSYKVKGIYFPGPLPPSSSAFREGRGSARDGPAPGPAPPALPHWSRLERRDGAEICGCPEPCADPHP